ncbi:hypothetical protein [Flagellimonas onchidii]|uniref:hypothetical protein n=1 Tax=Flagellimonas onchidii TaxID=2562684 RepID=UPI0010A6099C|nr:hypothetical protein [Allomuricauda onchidii]
MKKHSFLKFALSFIVLFVFFYSCEKEESLELETVQETEQSNVLVEEVDFNSIPELSEALNSVSGKSKLARSYSEKGDSKYWIDEEDILKLRDSVNNESYAVVIHSDKPSQKTLYNLIVTKRTDGNPITPFVIEYNFNSGEASNFSLDDENYFDGTINIYSLEQFADATGFNAKNTKPVICFPDVVQPKTRTANAPNSSSSGNAPSGSNGGSSTSGSGSTSGSSVSYGRPRISFTPIYGSKRKGKRATVYGGEVKLMARTSDPGWQKTTVGSISGKDNNPCPKGTVSIVVNVTEKIDNQITNPCAARIVNNANIADNSLTKDMKKAFGNDDSNFDLIYKQKDLPTNNNHQTLGQTNVSLRNGKIDNITIWLDSDFLKKGTDVSIFSVVIHENMHALMYYQLDRKGIAPSNPNVDLSILADQWSKAVAQNSNGVMPPDNLAYTQHEIMSGLVDTMAGYISNFAKSKGYQIDSSQALALAWVGLEDSVAWTVMDSDLKETYEDIIDYETTGFEILSVGTKCN